MITNIKETTKLLKDNSVKEVPIYFVNKKGFLEQGYVVNIYEDVNKVGNNYNHSIKFILKNKFKDSTVIYTKSFVFSKIIENVNWDLIISSDKIEYKNE